MSGAIIRMIDKILAERAGNNKLARDVIETKLILKGIYPERYTLQSEDDPKVLAKLEGIVKELDLKKIKKI